MVDVSRKSPTPRRAVASAVVTVGAEILAKIAARGFDKGDVLTTAKIAGIQAAKRTSELIPLCHGLNPEHVDVEINLVEPDSVAIRSTARITAATGVEMEALTAAAVAALTIYDMCKSAGKGITIGPIRLEEKTGGKSGAWRREAPA